MPPATADSVASRLFLGPALRTQPDKRLVTLVREGYEAAFEEIVRRYGKPLGRYAAAIVGTRAEDVTQDAFSKALLALRRDGSEVELRPWLYRIVRNTALNDLRDRPPSSQELGEAIEGGLSASEEAERREEIAELMSRLRALPEPQRAAIVMRELEGLSHEEIAAALGLTGGAARQAIHRARVALRGGLGMLIPVPLLRILIDQGAETATAGAGAGGAAVAAGASVGGAGAGGALKLGVATALIAGSVGAGVALHEHGHGNRGSSSAAASLDSGDSAAPGPQESQPSTLDVAAESRHGGGSRGRGGSGGSAHDEHGRNGNGRGEPGSGEGNDSDGGRSPVHPPGGFAQNDGTSGLGGDAGRGGPGEGHGSDQEVSGGHSGPGPGSNSGPGAGSRDGGSGGEPESGDLPGGGGNGGSGSGSGSEGQGSNSSGGPGPDGSSPPPPSGDDSHGHDGSGSSSGSGGGKDHP